jgi:hypothetical protein
MLEEASMRTSQAVPMPGWARLSPQRALEAKLPSRSAPSTVTVKTAAVSGNGAMGE